MRFLMMPEAHYHYGSLLVVDFVNYPVLTNSDAPISLRADHLATACKPRSCRECLYVRGDAFKLTQAFGYATIPKEGGVDADDLTVI